MLSKLTIEQIIASQKKRQKAVGHGLPRMISGFSSLSTHAFIVTGIRRCGKSTLLQQINHDAKTPSIYLNFEDPRLAGFDLGDFNRLHEIAESNQIASYFFDEIQLIDQWESFVRFRLDEGCRIFITGSNATMLSKELGTKLTGRHISRELFPFSYKEYLEFTVQIPCIQSAISYLKNGGFPEYLKTELDEVLMQNFNDIITRDIAVRYNIRNVGLLQQLAVWLLTNVGKLYTGNSLRKLFNIASSASIMEYLTYFTDAYLFFYIPKFSYSGKVQIVNPKKVYCIDTGLVNVNSISFSDDKGRLLENMVFMQLRRVFKEIYYFSEKHECDFVVFEKRKLKVLIQVCWQLDQDNMDREISGLKEAMDFFNVNQGYIITSGQSDSFNVDLKTIIVQPFHQWASETS